jgi:hypothetical protein
MLRAFTRRTPAHTAAVVAAGGIQLLVALLREGRCVKPAIKTLSNLAEDNGHGRAMLDAGFLAPLVRALPTLTWRWQPRVLAKLHTSCRDRLCEELGQEDVVRALVTMVSADAEVCELRALEAITWLAESSNGVAVDAAVNVVVQHMRDAEPKVQLAAVKALDALHRGGVACSAIVEAGALPLLDALQKEGHALATRGAAASLLALLRVVEPVAVPV